MKIIIIGAGIGGLTTAIALIQKGFSVEIYEASQELLPVGAGIVLASNVLQILERLNMLADIQARGEMLHAMNITDGKGKLIQKADLKKVEEKFGKGVLGIHRARLQAGLLANLPENIVHLGKKSVSITQNKDKVTVVFEDGTQAEGDICIGADGLRSVVRKSIFGEIPLRYSGQTCWRGISKMALPTPYKGNAYEMWGTYNGLRMGFLAVSDKEVYFFAVEKTPANGTDNPAERKEMLLKKYADFPSVVTEMIENTPLEKIVRHDINDFQPIKKWHEGRIVLIGDAAHATTPNMGQGGAQAIEDAWVIADCLAKHSNYAEAFAKFQAIRYEKAVWIVNNSASLGKMTNISGKFLTELRNFVFRLVPNAVAEKQTEKIYRLNF